MKKAWEQAWDETPWELRRRVQRWGPAPKGTWACRLKGERNQCPTCGDFFSGLEAFDAHRTGSWGKPGIPSKRRCLTLAEMIEKGFKRNEYFYWTAKGCSSDDGNAPSSSAGSSGTRSNQKVIG